MAASKTVSIRRYAPGDLDALIALFLGSVRTVAAKDYEADQIAAWAQADRAVWGVKRMDRPTWVAVVDGAVAGFSDLEADGHIDMMYVSAAHQGRGVASALLDAVEAAARGQGLERLFTEASLTARPFFERRGFRVIARQEVERNGAVLVNFRMERLLG